MPVRKKKPRRLPYEALFGEFGSAFQGDLSRMSSLTGRSLIRRNRNIGQSHKFISSPDRPFKIPRGAAAVRTGAWRNPEASNPQPTHF